LKLASPVILIKENIIDKNQNSPADLSNTISLVLFRPEQLKTKKNIIGEAQMHDKAFCNLCAEMDEITFALKNNQ